MNNQDKSQDVSIPREVWEVISSHVKGDLLRADSLRLLQQYCSGSGSSPSVKAANAPIIKVDKYEVCLN